MEQPKSPFESLVTLQEALSTVNPRVLASIKKYLAVAHIDSWNDLDKWHLMRFANAVKENVASSTAHTIFAVFKGLIAKFEEELSLPKGWRTFMEAKNQYPMKTYLTAEEVEAFGEAFIESHKERTVRDGFYVSCKTGLRHSDLVKLLPSNFAPREGGGWYLTYVSQKTKMQSTIFCSDATKEKVEWLHRNGVNVSLAYYNYMVRELAERAGIDKEVVVFKAGKELSGPKYKFLSSHSARISFCTILGDLGTDILDIMRLAGHTDPAMTARYIVRHEVKINEKVEKFLM